MNLTSINKLKTIQDLEKLRKLAQDRDSWCILVDEIYNTAKAEKNIVF